MKEVCDFYINFRSKIIKLNFFSFLKLYIVPSPPRNVTVQRVNNLMARVQWSEPLQPNGRIIGYHIYVHNMAANLTEVKRFQTSDLSQHLMEYTIHNLSTDNNFFKSMQNLKSIDLLPIRTIYTV